MRRQVRYVSCLVVSCVLLPVRFTKAHTGDANPFPESPPAALGVDPANLQYICDEIQKWVDAKEVLGAEVHIIKDRKTVLHKSFGLKDQERNLSMVNDTIFCVRSQTKPVAGTAIQILIDESKIALDDPAAKYLPSFDNDKSRGITIRHLLTHTSGLPLSLVDKTPKEYKSIEEIAETSGAHGPDFEPGSDFQYSDEGADALGAIVANVSGVSFDEFVRTRILQPCDMRDAITAVKADDPKLSRIAPGYYGSKEGWEKFWDNDSDGIFPFLFASQSLFCTTTDYGRFLAMWMDKGTVTQEDMVRRIISEDVVKRALSPVSKFEGYPVPFDDCEVWYGQMWQIYKQAKDPPPAMPIFGHGGSDGTIALAFPDQNLIAMYFTQSRGGTTVLGFERLLRPLIGQSRDAPSQEATALSIEQMQPLTGFYHIEEMKAIACVLVRDGHLAIEIPDQTVFALKWPNVEGKWEFDLLKGAFVKFGAPPNQANARAPSLTIFQSGMEIEAPRYVPPANLPSVDELMALRRKTHGEDQLKALRNYRLTGTVHVAQGKKDGKATLLVEGGRRYEQRLDFDGRFEHTIVKDGRAWVASQDAPMAEQKDTALGQKLRAFQPYRLGDLKDLFADVVVLRSGTLKDEPMYVIRAAPAVSNAVRIVVSEKTGLTLAENSMPFVKGIGVLPTRTVYEDYRSVDGVQIPFRAISDSPLIGKITIQYDKVETNLDLDSDAFMPPASESATTSPE